MSDRMDAGLADEALKMAIARRRPPAGCKCLYDRVRTHSALGHLSPEEFEARNRKGAARAA